MAQGLWLQNRLVVGSIPIRGNEIFIYINIFIYSLWCRVKAQSLHLQWLQNSAKNGERSVLTLSYLCLPCCVRDTAWSWLYFFPYKTVSFISGGIHKVWIKMPCHENSMKMWVDLYLVFLHSILRQKALNSFNLLLIIFEASSGTKSDWLWVRSPLEEMKYLKARRCVPLLNTQCIQNLAETGERIVLTLGSLCLPCYVRDTAWS